jgi:hypothetical protein
LIPFAVYAPDRPVLESQTTGYVNNVLPLGESYGPIKAVVTAGSSLTARCQGAASFRGEDGTIVTFSGDATKLYLWDGTDWDDVSRLAGGAYAVDSTGRWTFEQFGNVVIALNGIDAPQAWTIGTSNNFAALAGSPPVARYGATVRDFYFVGYLSSVVSGIRWSSQFNATSWTIGVDQADEQTFQNDGRITGICGGQYAVVFQETGIHKGTYVGPSNIFQFDQVAVDRGCMIPGSIAQVEQTIVFADNDGFYRLDGGEVITPIGVDLVNQFFWKNIDQNNLHRVWSVIDHRTMLYWISYPSTASTNGEPDSILIYSLQRNKWARASFGEHVLFTMFDDLSVDLDTDIDVADQNLDGAGLPSLDSDIYFGVPVPLLAVFDSTFKLGFFSGDNLAAEADTVEAQLGKGRRVMVDNVLPIVDGGTLSVKLATRDRPNDTPSFNTYVSQNNSGECRFRSSAKQHRARVMVASGGIWTHMQGVNFNFQIEGDR